jgi:hypothetical protein
VLKGFLSIIVNIFTLNIRSEIKMPLDTLADFQSTLDRPNDPTDPNGISHATDSADTGDGSATKAARATAKIAWANYVQDYREAYKVGDSSGPAEFPDNGEIDYADD